jgi:hypothetical protein
VRDIEWAVLVRMEFITFSKFDGDETQDRFTMLPEIERMERSLAFSLVCTEWHFSWPFYCVRKDHM